MLCFLTQNMENRKKGLKLPVYEGRFKHRFVSNENYTEQLKGYIEWNPVKHKLVNSPEEWKYSSYEKSNPVEHNLSDINSNLLFD